MQDKELNTVLRKYFDWKFEGAYFTRQKDDSGFYGFYINREALFVTNDEDLWYYDGTSFMGGFELFGLKPREFANMMKKYVLETYPEYKLKINGVF